MTGLIPLHVNEGTYSDSRISRLRYTTQQPSDADEFPVVQATNKRDPLIRCPGVASVIAANCRASQSPSTSRDPSSLSLIVLHEYVRVGC